tara:strand:+ start:7120 stop:7665 length:546 start_codon:yes stop_codon:yes gene_type:complete
MGQYDNDDAGIYLVENVEDVATLAVKNPEQLAYVTQTTLSMDDTSKVIDALRQKFPKIQGPKKDDICYATQNRQDAVKALAEQSDVVLVVGSVASSNSNRLRELAERMGCQAHLVDGAQDLKREWFADNTTIGVTAGASAPEILVKEVITQLKSWGATTANEIKGVEETITFALPKALRTS